jgi:hypothetical protein
MAFDKQIFESKKVQFPEERRQKILLIVLGVVIVAIIAVLYYGFGRSSGGSTAATTSGATSTSVGDFEKIKKINFNNNFLETDLFNDLQNYGTWPPETEEGGRENPFSPNSEDSGGSLDVDTDNSEAGDTEEE